MIEVHVVDTFDKLLLLEEEWNAALARSDHKSVFLTFEWITTWWKYYSEGRGLLVVVVRREGEVSCIAPFMTCVSSRFGLSIRKIEFIGSILSNWLDFVAVEGTADSIHEVIDFLLGCAGRWDVIDLRNVPLSSRIIPAFEGHPQHGHYTLYTEADTKCFYLPLNGEWGAYLKGRDRKFRENLRRIDRKISKLDDIQFEQLYCPEEIQKSLDMAYEIERMSPKAERLKTIFGDENARRFFREIAQTLSEKGWLVLSLLKMNGRPIAYDFSFLFNDTFFGYNSAYDRRYAELSPGVFLLENILKNLFQTSVKEADLYRGGESYKKKWTESTRGQTRLMVFHRGSPRARMFSILVPTLRPVMRKMNLFREGNS